MVWEKVCEGSGFLAGRLASQNRMGSVIVIVGGMAMILMSLLLTVPSEGRAIDLWFIDLFKFVERGERTGEVLPVPLVMIVFTTLLWSRGVRIAGMRHEGAVGAFVVGTVAVAGLLLVSALLPSGSTAEEVTSSPSMQNVVSGLAPLFLVAIPAAILFSLLAPAMGEWASTAGELSLVSGWWSYEYVYPGANGGVVRDPYSRAGWASEGSLCLTTHLVGHKLILDVYLPGKQNCVQISNQSTPPAGLAQVVPRGRERRAVTTKYSLKEQSRQTNLYNGPYRHNKWCLYFAWSTPPGSVGSCRPWA